MSCLPLKQSQRNCDTMTGARSVREWHRYSCEELDNYGFADRILLDRGSHKHWVLYVGDGRVVYLKPKMDPNDNGDSGGGGGPWHPGAISQESLANLAGSDRLRAVRVGGGQQRPDDDIKMLVDILVGSSILKYCAHRFDCEHFINFLKFGKPVSGQILLAQKQLLQRMVEPSSTSGPAPRTTSFTPATATKKLKTKPVSKNPAERKAELQEICMEVARIVEEESRDELDKYLFE